MFALLVVAAAFGLTGALAGCAPQQAGAEGKTPIGVFRREPVLVAFYRSKAFDEKPRAMIAEQDRAKARGDENRVAELEAEGRRMQEFAHRQLAGDAPLKNVLEHLGKALPEVARKAGVAVIVEQPAFADETVEFVDVTGLLLERLPPARAEK